MPRYIRHQNSDPLFIDNQEIVEVARQGSWDIANGDVQIGEPGDLKWKDRR
jgi:hypothetical protein